jgi:hypothetical protein
MLNLRDVDELWRVLRNRLQQRGYEDQYSTETAFEIHVWKRVVALAKDLGIGTPRGLQGRLAVVGVLIVALWARVVDGWHERYPPLADPPSSFTPHHRFELLPVSMSEGVL